MVDVVDVLDAFEAKRKRQPKVTSENRRMANRRQLLRARNVAGWHNRAD
jgi:hypothetical protein